MTNKLILPITLLSLIIGSGLAMTKVQAVTSTDPHTSLIQKFVSKFNLKEGDVQTVFTEARTERQAEMRNRFEQRLTQLVTDKKITEAQKTLIVAKHDEMQTNQERERTELQAWADKNGVDLSYLMFGRGGHGMGFGSGMKRRW